MRYWLVKSEPDTFSIDDLKDCEGGIEHWDGVRNYQARNMMRDEMKKGDLVFFYHSNCSEPGIVGVAEVVKEGYPDFTAWDPESRYFDSKSSPENPRWSMVDIKYLYHFEKKVTLSKMREIPELAGMKLLQKGQRLSVQPVESDVFQLVCQLGERK